MRATVHAASLKSAATLLNNEIPFPLEMNGSPIRRCTSSLPPKGRFHDQTRHAVSASLAVLHRAQSWVTGRHLLACPLCRLPTGVTTPMVRERVYLFDTTLRDGAQTNGVDFTLVDKLAIAAMLDELGIDYVEGGYPGANPTDTELFGK